MVKIKDLGNGNYQTFPLTDDMIEVDDLDAWVEANRPVTETSAEETAKVEDRKRYYELLALLGATDWIVLKIYETYLTSPDDVEALTTKYAETLTNRASWREEINELQEKYGF